MITDFKDLTTVRRLIFGLRSRRDVKSEKLGLRISLKHPIDKIQQRGLRLWLASLFSYSKASFEFDRIVVTKTTKNVNACL